MSTNETTPKFDWGMELIDLVTDLICVCRDGQVVFINVAGTKLLGGEAIDIVGRPFADFLPPDKTDSSLVVGNAPSLLTLYRQDGSPVQTEILARKCRGDTEAILVRARDMTVPSDKMVDDDVWTPEQNQLLLAASIFDIATEGIVLCDENRSVYAVNQGFSTVTGHAHDGIEGASLSVLAPNGDTESFLADMWIALDGVGRWQRDVTIRSADGPTKSVLVSAIAARDDNEITHAYVVMIAAPASRDGSRDNSAELTKNETTIDPATGLPRLAPFLGRLSQAVAAASRSGQRIGVMLVDVRGLTPSGADQQQHDVTLKKTVAVLSSCVRDYDVLARLSDTVFAIVMSNLEKPHSAAIVARRIMQKFEQMNSEGHHLIASIGITVYPVDGPDTDSLIRDAESAMRKAKTFSSPNFHFFDPELNRDSQGILSLWNELSLAHEKAEFYIEYQPRIDLVSGRATAVEALLRWRNPKLGIVEPRRLIPAMEEIGCMETVGAWMFEDVCRQQVEWTNAGHLHLHVSLNLSDRQLRQRDFLAIVRDTVRRTGADPSRIEFEIIEEMLVRDAENCVGVLWGLREIGITVVLDDFGSSDGSVNRLRRFPISVVKIDPQFIADLSGGQSAAIRAIVGMAHGFEQTVVAEGVETEKQLKSLRLSGCDEVQGFLFCPPLSAIELSARLEIETWSSAES